LQLGILKTIECMRMVPLMKGGIARKASRKKGPKPRVEVLAVSPLQGALVTQAWLRLATGPQRVVPRVGSEVVPREDG